jgi:pimeloyl-ACP methyl ester carboxylesterase
VLPPSFEVEVEGRPAFVVLPDGDAEGPLEWVWYAPTFADDLPNARHEFIVDRVLGAGMAFAGIDVGESYGSPEGRALFTAFHRHVTERYGLAEQAVLLPQSRGGLMHYTWASENPQLVRRIAGIYTVCDLRDWPGVDVVAEAHGRAVAELEAEVARHNPVDLVRPLAEAGVPVLHIHGDSDTLIPLEPHSAALLERYRAAGGDAELVVVAGKGHEEIDEFFCAERFAAFLTGRPARDSSSAAPA